MEEKANICYTNHAMGSAIMKGEYVGKNLKGKECGRGISPKILQKLLGHPTGYGDCGTCRFGQALVSIQDLYELQDREEVFKN